MISILCEPNTSDKQLSFLVFVHGFKEVSLGIVCMSTFIRNTSLAGFRVGSFAWELSFGILRFETFVWNLSVDSLRLGPAIFCCVESLDWELRSTLCVLNSLRIVRCETFAWDLELGNSPRLILSFGYFPWRHWFGIFRLGSFAWEHSLGILSFVQESIIVVCEFSLGMWERSLRIFRMWNFVLGSVIWNLLTKPSWGSLRLLSQGQQLHLQCALTHRNIEGWRCQRQRR